MDSHVHAEAARRAAEVFARVGNGRGGDPEILDETLARYAERAERDLIAFSQTVRRGECVDHLPYPDTYRDLLAVVAAFRAAMGYSPTPTSREVFERRADVAGDWREAQAELPATLT